MPVSTTITERGRRTRRLLIWLGVAVVVLNLTVWGLSQLGPGGAVSGPDGSTYVTTGSGAAALEGMLERLDIPTARSRVTLDEATLASDASLVMIDVGDADFTTAELNSVDAFLRGGGRLVVAGRSAMPERLVEDAPRWRAAGSGTGTLSGDLVDTDTGELTLGGLGSLETGAADQVFLTGDGDLVVGTWRSVGEGTLIWLADSFPLHNQGIGVGDAAVVVVDLLGGGSPVLFDEYRHGYADGAGLWAALPPGWRVTLALAGVTTVLAVVAYGRRTVPIHEVERRLAPGRERYLDAVAGILSRSGSTEESLEVIRAEARHRLEGDGRDPRDTAKAAGLDVAEIDALLGDGSGHDTLLIADAALARLDRERR